MPSCILCGREATITPADGGMEVNCPDFCQHYTLAAVLTEKIPKQSDQFRRDLARALRWYFYRREPGEPPITLPDLISAQLLIAKFEDEQDPKKRKSTAMHVLADAKPVPDALDVLSEPMTVLGRALGLPANEARVFAEDLRDRGFMRIVPCYESLSLPPGEQHFGRSERWERCEERSPAPEPEAE